MVYNVQVLRAIAALMVVHGHAGAGGLGLDYRFGGLNGVDLFFVISGFIIAYVADFDSDQFMLRRLVRIVPIYWVSTLAIYIIAVVAPQHLRTTSSDGELLLRSLLFIPDPTAVHTKDGLPHPTLAGGWTLNFEMYFYAMFWVALSLSKRFATLIAACALSLVVAIVNLTSLDDSPVAHFYGYPIIFEFMFGMLAFHVVRHVEQASWRHRAPGLQRIALIVIAALALYLLASRILSDDARWFSNGIPAFFLVVAAVLLERMHGVAIKNRVLVLLGDASYVLYLSHAYVVFGTIRLVIGKRTFSEPVGQLVVVGLMAVSCVVAIALYLLVEKPMLRFFKHYLVRTRVPRTSSG
jgi:exopolysaccharide production protein ExoZ